MRKTEVRKAIFSGLHRLVEQKGFKPKKSPGLFVRKFAGGEHRLLIPLADYQPVFIFSLVVCVRIDEAARIFQRFTGMDPRYFPETVSSITQLKYFFGVDKKEYRVTAIQDISAAMDDLAPVLAQKILPMLDDCIDVRRLDIKLNSGAFPGFDSTNLPAAALNSLIVARLAGNPRFEELAERYRQEMRDFDDNEKAELNRLVQYLGNEAGERSPKNGCGDL
jgi:hypothetical protein